MKLICTFDLLQIGVRFWNGLTYFSTKTYVSVVLQRSSHMGAGHSLKSHEQTREAGDWTPLPATPGLQGARFIHYTNSGSY